MIINVGSMAGYRPLTRTIAYSAARAAVSNFTQWLAVHMAQEYSPRIRVNAIAPILYLKQVEGLTLYGKPVRPRSVSARSHEITRNPAYQDPRYVRSGHHDVEDYCQLHVVFDDGMVADVFASEIVMGGIYNYLEIFANNHRTRCNLSPNNSMALSNPKEEQLAEVYIVEKLRTKQGWSLPVPDESFMFGSPQEIQDLVEAIATGRKPKSGPTLGADTVAVLYGAYLSSERKGQEVEIPG